MAGHVPGNSNDQGAAKVSRHRTKTFLNCHGSLLSISSGNSMPVMRSEIGQFGRWIEVPEVNTLSRELDISRRVNTRDINPGIPIGEILDQSLRLQCFASPEIQLGRKIE